MVVEVAPAELAAKGLGPLAARQPLLELARARCSRSAGRARGARCGRAPSASWLSAYSRTGPSRKRVERVAAPRASPPGGGLADLLVEPERVERRASGPWRSLDGSGGSSRGRLEHRRGAAPRARCGEKGEKTVYGLPGLGRDSRDVVDGVQARVARAARRPASRERRADRARRAGGRTGSRRGEVDRLGAGLARERGELALGLAVADRPARSRARAARASSSARHSSRNCVRGPGRVAAVQQPVVEAEDRRPRARARRAPPAAPGGRAPAGRAETRRVPVAQFPPLTRQTYAGGGAQTTPRDQDSRRSRRCRSRRPRQRSSSAAAGVVAEAAAQLARRGAIRGAGGDRQRAARADQRAVGRAPGPPWLTSRRSSPTAEAAAAARA